MKLFAFALNGEFLEVNYEIERSCSIVNVRSERDETRRKGKKKKKKKKKQKKQRRRSSRSRGKKKRQKNMRPKVEVHEVDEKGPRLLRWDNVFVH